MFLHQYSRLPQCRKETIRIPDCSNGMNRLTLEFRQFALLFRVSQLDSRTRLHCHREFITTAEAVYNHHINFPEPLEGFAQRAGRQGQAIAETTHSINNSNLHITLQGIVLQPVITHYDVTIIVFDQGAGCCNPVWPNRHRAVAETCH